MKRNSMPLKAQVGLIHTRLTTQGSEQDNANNHPIYNAGIIGVHNGVLHNDDELFRYVYKQGGERHGKVDSEAIFAALAWRVGRFGIDGQATVEDVLESVVGSAAIAWMEETGAEDELFVARISQSPLVLGRTPNGSTIFASTTAAVKAAAAAVGLDINVTIYPTEGTGYHIKGGELVKRIDFMPYWKTGRSLGSTIYRSGWSEREDYWEDDLESHRVGCFVSRPGSQLELVKDTAEENAAPEVSVLAEDLDSPLSLARAGFDRDDNRTKRWSELDAFRDAFRGDVADRYKLIESLHGYARVGTWVKTTVQGVENTPGQIYELPNSFPGGSYIIRVLLNNASRLNNVEWGFVSRRCNEFEVTIDKRSPGDLDATAKLYGDDKPSRRDWLTTDGVWIQDEFVPFNDDKEILTNEDVHA